MVVALTGSADSSESALLSRALTLAQEDRLVISALV